MSEIQIDPQKINEFVAKAIIESAIGTKLKEAIEKEVQSLSQSYENPIIPIVKSEMRTLLTEIIRNDYREKIEEYVKQNISTDLMEKIISKMWQYFENKAY